MNSLARSVSLHPYFKVHAGQLPAVQRLLREFVAKTTREEKALYYEFTVSGDVVFCREAYTDAAGVLVHLANVDAELKQMLTLSELSRLEVHGPAAELEQLKGPLGGLQPAWFAYECGLQR